MELIVLAARSLGGGEMRDLFRSAAQEVSDWELAVDVASEHHLVPILARAISEHASDCVSPRVLEDMQRLYLANTREAGQRTEQLVGLLDTLGQAGVAALPLKGPVLALYAYGDIALRTSYDLDVIVAQTKVATAIELLRQMGFEPKESLSRSQLRTTIRFGNELAFVTGGSRTPAELHWRIVQKPIMCRLDLDDLLSRASTVSVLGHEVPWPSRADLAIVLCVHGAKHHWAQLELAHCLAEVLRADRFDWHQFLREARRARCWRRCLLGVLLAGEVFGAAVPEEVLDLARRERAIGRLCSQAVRSYTEPLCYTLPLLREMRWNMATLDGPSSRARYLVLRTFVPSAGDWAWVTLPDWAHVLYYALRPARLALSYARRCRRSSGRRPRRP